MPAAFTHYIVAREAWKALPDNVQQLVRPHLPLYFFGAQGADFCFFYKFYRSKRKNLGSFLHREGGFTAFRVLKAFTQSSPSMLAYALGFITHYATDTAFHPFVYEVSKSSLLKHNRIENALDGYFKRSTRKSADPYKEFLSHKLSSQEEQELFLLYAAIAAKCGFPPLSKTPFQRAIRLFNAYLPMPNAIFGNTRDFKSSVNGYENADKEIADRLFLRAVVSSCELAENFLNAVKEKSPLSYALFGKSYLTGK